MTKDTRREFLKKATLLTGAAGLFSVMPASIQRALAINAEAGTTYLDAEHIVFLMQENRSFDHCFGTLSGVRGFDDPRAMTQPSGNKIWMQGNKQGETHIPFNLDIKESKATWMRALPHSWDNQVDARNGGKMNKWLDSKQSGNAAYANMPLTLGFYDRKDIPFYYAFADAFTVCDQHFCSSLTGTSANRSYFWSGTIRDTQNKDSLARVYNDEINFRDLTWKTFPERLEEIGISWKIYQNELSIAVGLSDEEEDWLGNFTDNNLEFFKQYHVRLHKAHLDFLARHEAKLKQELEDLKSLAEDVDQQKKISEKKLQLDKIIKERLEWNQERFDQLSDFEKNIHQKAFVTNVGDPAYHQLETISFNDNGQSKSVKLPKGDILHQFRNDVEAGNLPAVTWLTSPGNFSDHPSSPWYGAWYVSEVLDILTKNPAVWKKTIFILTYDENDGYFDHAAPFVPPHSGRPETGKCSPGLETEDEFVTWNDEKKRGKAERLRRESPIGLGYRVPMVVASPWSKGGWVNSQIFDHTSCLQFLETFIQQKKGKEIKETNISDWRRAICGDLTSIFRPYSGEKMVYPKPIVRNKLVQDIQQAKSKGYPTNYSALTEKEIEDTNNDTFLLARFPRQEKGQRPSCALPYHFDVNGDLDTQKENFVISMNSKDVGAPFTVATHKNSTSHHQPNQKMNVWDFAVIANSTISYEWPLSAFEKQQYELSLNGANGFFRKFTGDNHDPELTFKIGYLKEGNILLRIKNNAKTEAFHLTLEDAGYHQFINQLTISAQQETTVQLDLQKSNCWYDFAIYVKDRPNFSRNFAGRVETKKSGLTDPQIGRSK